MRIALAQINPVVGGLKANAELILSFYEKAVNAQADIAVFPELSICGYPPEDLLHKKHFLDDNLAAVKKIAKSCTKTIMVAGFAEPDGSDCHNSAAIMQNGEIKQIYRKALLPNYGVFDEERYFEPGTKPCIIKSAGLNIAVTICRDIWDITWLKSFLDGQNFDVLLNISASPFHVGKIDLRQQVLSKCAQELKSAVCYCNLVGGQDELVFDGRSIIADSRGKIAVQGAAFEQDLIVADIIKAEKDDIRVEAKSKAPSQPAGHLEEIYNALVLGTRDYVTKNGFEKVLIGLSGGIDSSLVAVIAAQALGKQNVIAITMPSKFSAEETKSDAAKLAENLGVEFHSIAIEQTLESFDNSLKSIAGWDNKGLAYENLQARIRGIILMSLSNQLAAMVLTTGNKSETAVGYSTLYGDTAGGFAVIKDVPKTKVYKLANYINEISRKEIIPKSVITRAPTAELRPNQKDTDSLPEYDLLDNILEGYIELDKSPRQLVKDGLPKEQVLRVVKMVDQNEYKRRLSPPGIKITPKAFGKDRRLPITNHYKPNIQ
ncbi:MAG: NAD+ synthase [Phycisphaerae bacterium]